MTRILTAPTTGLVLLWTLGTTAMATATGVLIALDTLGWLR